MWYAKPAIVTIAVVLGLFMGSAGVVATSFVIVIVYTGAVECWLTYCHRCVCVYVCVCVCSVESVSSSMH